jgi:hypothetical protein
MEDLEPNYGPPYLRIAGLAIWVYGYQFPEAEDYYDGNWLRVAAHCGASGAMVRVDGSLFMTLDVARFRDECGLLLQKSVKTAKLKPLEPELLVSIEEADSPGHLIMRVDMTPDSLTQNHTMFFEIDQSYLPSIITGCTRILREFPVRCQFRKQ